MTEDKKSRPPGRSKPPTRGAAKGPGNDAKNRAGGAKNMAAKRTPSKRGKDGRNAADKARTPFGKGPVKLDLGRSDGVGIDSLADLIRPLGEAKERVDPAAASEGADHQLSPPQAAAIPAGYRAGLVALAGRPNVGKSSLVNRLVGQKVSIVTHKAQTTRHRIAGVASFPQGQLVLLDTPGIHRQAGNALNRQMNRTAEKTLADADVVLMVVEAGRWTQEDQDVLKRVLGSGRPCFAVVNKVDRLSKKEALLPYVQTHFGDPQFSGVFLVSARTGAGLERLISEALKVLPESAPLYPLDQVSDRPVRFLCAELIREQLMERLHEELPYGLTVTVEEWEQHDNGVVIRAAIWVSRDSHKGMVIGKAGLVLKQVGSAARQGIEQLVEQRVMLHLWVRVRADWSDDDQALGQFGYVEP